MKLRTVVVALCCAAVLGCGEDGSANDELVMGDFGTLTLSGPDPGEVGTTFEAVFTDGRIGEGFDGAGSVLGSRRWWGDAERTTPLDISFAGLSFAEAEVFEMRLFIASNGWIWSPGTASSGSLDLDLEAQTLTFNNLTLNPVNVPTPITLDGTLTW